MMTVVSSCQPREQAKVGRSKGLVATATQAERMRLPLIYVRSSRWKKHSYDDEADSHIKSSFSLSNSFPNDTSFCIMNIVTCSGACPVQRLTLLRH